MEKFDVIVVGGGYSGSVAAISAARNGMKTLLIESAGFPGGSLTRNSVAPMMSFHSGDEQVSLGISQEIIERLMKKGKSLGHITDPDKFTSTYTVFDEEGMKFEIESMLLESGVKLLYHTMLAGVRMDGNEIKCIEICNKGGITSLEASYYIDATGDADLVAMSGNEYQKGREEDGKAQPLTLMVKISNVDKQKIINYIRNESTSFKHKDNIEDILNNRILAMSGFVDEFKLAKSRDEIHIPREDILLFESNNPREFYFNTVRVLDHDSTDPWSYSDAETVGRKQAQELERFLKKYIPGFEESWISLTGPSIGSRSSRQLIGEYVLNEQDILNKTIFPDAIAFSGYPIDIHSPDGEGTAHGKLPWGSIYSIPFRSTLPKNTTNLLVSGRCISTTFSAQAAIRTTPTVGAIGEAVGIAVSIACKHSLPVQKVDVRQIQEQLVKQGAYFYTKEKKG